MIFPPINNPVSMIRYIGIGGVLGFLLWALYFYIKDIITGEIKNKEKEKNV